MQVFSNDYMKAYITIHVRMFLVEGNMHAKISSKILTYSCCLWKVETSICGLVALGEMVENHATCNKH